MYLSTFVLALTIVSVSPSSAVAGAIPDDDGCGDVDGDGHRSVRDALLLLRVAVDPFGGACPNRRCDLTGDHDVSSADALAALRYAVGLPQPLDCRTGVCAVPLDEYSLSSLAFGLSNEFEMEPGTSRTFDLGLFECCYYWEPIDVCATLSVSPQGAGATINPFTGRFELDEDVSNGSEFTITADVENGRDTVNGWVYVYEPSLNPLRGTRSEVAQLPCDGGDERVPAEPIRELLFFSNGRFNVTWEPFELYVDYWGDYTFDPETSALSMTITGGNYVPDDFDGEGNVTFESGQVVLRDMWLGSPQNGGSGPACGHRFE